LHSTTCSLVGLANRNPLLDTRIYEVEFPDGHSQEFAANVIAESLYSQVDEEGREFALLDEILEHSRDASAVSKDDEAVEKRGANSHRRRTTKGWKLLVQWKDGSTTWEPMTNLKESTPVQVAEYAVANKIADEPAFAWWIGDILRRINRNIAKVSLKYWKRTHKFGLLVSKTVKEALEIDQQTGTDVWQKAIALEMKNVQPALSSLMMKSKYRSGISR
jgi:hypothetical protein